MKHVIHILPKSQGILSGGFNPFDGGLVTLALVILLFLIMKGGF